MYLRVTLFHIGLELDGLWGREYHEEGSFIGLLKARYEFRRTSPSVRILNGPTKMRYSSVKHGRKKMRMGLEQALCTEPHLTVVGPHITDEVNGSGKEVAKHSYRSALILGQK